MKRPTLLAQPQVTFFHTFTTLPYMIRVRSLRANLWWRLKASLRQRQADGEGASRCGQAASRRSHGDRRGLDPKGRRAHVVPARGYRLHGSGLRPEAKIILANVIHVDFIVKFNLCRLARFCTCVYAICSWSGSMTSINFCIVKLNNKLVHVCVDVRWV